MFARVGEEAADCARYGIPYEVIPGVTAGLAAPLYTGIPLTHRGIASSVAFVTGHHCNGMDPPDWGELADQVDTLVIYMGVSNLPHLCQSLINHGCSPDTLVVVIRWGTWNGRQETYSGTLGNMEEKVRRKKLLPPPSS